MEAVQLTFSLSLSVNSFDNVDLHRRGYYRLQFNLTPPCPGGSVQLETFSRRNKASGKEEWCQIINDGCTAVCAPVLIQYAKQHCDVLSHFSGNFTMLVPSKQVFSTDNPWPSVSASLDLYFAPLRREESNPPMPSAAGYDKIDSRTLQLSVCNITHQLHSGRYVLFRCRNQSGVKLQLHAALTAARPVLVEKAKDKGSFFSWLNPLSTELPSCDVIMTSPPTVQLTLLRQLCRLLLDTQVGLMDKCHEFVASEMYPFDRQPVESRVAELLSGCNNEVSLLQALDHLNTAGAVALSMWDVALLVLWQEKEKVDEELVYDFHQKQVHRFRQLHFLSKRPMAELLLSASGDSRLPYNRACEMMAAISKTGYFGSVFADAPPVMCSETDGTPSNAPIIMEQRFVCDKATRHSSSAAKSSSPSVIIHRKAPNAAPSLTSATPTAEMGTAAASRGVRTRGASTPGPDETDGLFSGRGPRSSRPTVQSARLSIGLAREHLRQHMPKDWLFISETSKMTVPPPYFVRPYQHPSSRLHIVVCVHGLEGHSDDLVCLKNLIELSLPDQPLHFLMAQSIEERTLDSFQELGGWLAEEVVAMMENCSFAIARLSFVGHSLGNIVIRVALSSERMRPYLHLLHTYLSLAGPHLGTVYTGSLVGAGMWVLQKYTKSSSLLELKMRDSADPRQTLLYRLSLQPGLALFQHVLLVGSHQDEYVPFHSARIEASPLAANDDMGCAQQEMVHNLLFPLQSESCHAELRIYNLLHQFPSTDIDVLVGRAGHIALLDSELCLEKLVLTCLYRFFQI